MESSFYSGIIHQRNVIERQGQSKTDNILPFMAPDADERVALVVEKEEEKCLSIPPLPFLITWDIIMNVQHSRRRGGCVIKIS